MSDQFRSDPPVPSSSPIPDPVVAADAAPGAPAARQERAAGDTQGAAPGAPADHLPDPGLPVRPDAAVTPPGAGTDAGTAPGSPDATDRAREVAERLRPVAAAAEELAATAIDLSVKGLNRLAQLLEERKAARRPADADSGTDQPPPTA